MKINDYRDLKVWQLAMEVAEQVYQLCGTFPQHQQFTLVSQMQRASISVPSNIAEGHERHSTKDFCVSFPSRKDRAPSWKLSLGLRSDWAIAPRQRSRRS